ncbi:MAG: SRPBCC family protein [Anderseniella sp.]
MLKVHESAKLKASAIDLWAAIGSFGNLAEWHPAAVTSTLETRGDDTVRLVSIPGGGLLVEKLEAHDEDAMSQTYSIVESPLPVSEYLSTLKVIPQGDSECTVDWSGSFKANGVEDQAAIKIITGIYTAGLNALKKRFGEQS